MILALSGIGAAPVPTAEPAGLICIPLLQNCAPTPSPSPTPTPAPGTPLPGLPIPIPGIPGIPGATPPATTAPGATVPLPAVVGVPDPTAPVFTLPAAQLGGSSISFSGLKSVSVVTVPLIDGTRTTALKLQADDIVITDFVLDVRKATGPSLVSTATRMELRGNVSVYVDSVTASLLGGGGLTLLANTPPPGNELPPTLLRVNLGLVGVTADSIAFVASHQQIHD